MLVTIYTDASFANDLRQGAWAFYAKSDRGSMVYSGLCPEDEFVFDNGHAELFAVAKSVHRVLAKWPNAKTLLINSDSDEVCRFLQPLHADPKVKSDHKKNLANRLLKFLANTGIRLRVRHVKAHTAKDDVRSRLNALCDKQCKAALKKKRDSLPPFSPPF